MEEIPASPENLTPKIEITQDPEKIGDLLLRYEIPKPEKPSLAVPLLIEQNPKVVISRENLRTKIRRYRHKRFGRSKEQLAGTRNDIELSEAHFDRRSEVIDEQYQHDSLAIETKRAAAEAFNQGLSHAQAPPAVPPPAMSYPVNYGKQPSSSPLLSYKKPLFFGLLAGILTGAALIFVYFK